MTETLIKNGANIETKDENGNTPLFKAIGSGNSSLSILSIVSFTEKMNHFLLCRKREHCRSIAKKWSKHQYLQQQVYDCVAYGCKCRYRECGNR